MSERTSAATTTFATPSDREITMTRVFDAPRELVFAAHTDAQHVQNWWGQRNSTTIVDVLDVRPGGAWRFVQRDPEGNEYGFRGEFREVVPPERLVYTFEFEGMPGHIVVDTITFEEHDGKTTILSTSLFESVEDRDGMLESGMESGAYRILGPSGRAPRSAEREVTRTVAKVRQLFPRQSGMPRHSRLRECRADTYARRDQMLDSSCRATAERLRESSRTGRPNVDFGPSRTTISCIEPCRRHESQGSQRVRTVRVARRPKS